MKLSQQIAYAAGIGFTFVLAHILMAYCKLTPMANLVITLGLMLLAQLVAFSILKRRHATSNIKFKSIFSFLCLTQCMAILFLTLNALINPFEKPAAIDPVEVLMSLIIFGGIFSLLTSSIIWFSSVRTKHNIF